MSILSAICGQARSLATEWSCLLTDSRGAPKLRRNSRGEPLGTGSVLTSAHSQGSGEKRLLHVPSSEGMFPS